MSEQSRPGVYNPRSWVVLFVIAGLVMSFVIGWGAYLYGRTQPRWQQLAAGEALTTNSGETVKLNRLLTSTTLGKTITGPNVAPPGTVYVIAQLEGSRTGDLGTCSAFDLVATDGRTWTALNTIYGRDVATSCLSAPLGQTVTFELYFLVPTSAVPQLAGLGQQHLLGLARSRVLVPAA